MNGNSFFIHTLPDGEMAGKNGCNKLRTYTIFKHDYVVENYCKLLMTLSESSVFIKLRYRVASIRLGTWFLTGL